MGLTIVQHNDLIESSYRLDIDELRLINLCLSKVDSRKGNLGMFSVYADEFASMFNLNKKEVCKNMKRSIASIMTKPVTMFRYDKNNNKIKHLISWIDEASFYVDNDIGGGKIDVRFTKGIEPYLFELHSNFTKLNFEYASKLNTSFSFRLYQWLIKQHRINENGMYELSLTLDEIKTNAGLTGSYSVWKDLKQKVIDPAVLAINTKTNISVDYEIIKRGNKTFALNFLYIDETDKKQLNDFKPVRPRLARRPKVLKGSHEENEWMKINFKILRDYRIALKTFDNSLKLTIPDLQKLIIYSRLNGLDTHEECRLELAERKAS